MPKPQLRKKPTNRITPLAGVPKWHAGFFVPAILMVVRIAITGGIAEGKSTVIGYLDDLGFETTSADVVAREVLADPAIQQRVASLTNLPSPIDKAALRELIAASPEIRRGVNAIMHPEIVRRLDSSASTFFEVPLLIETCRYFEFDQVWVVTCGREEQLIRLRQRYADEVQVQAIIRTQIASDVKEIFADRVIRTNFPPETVRHMVSEATASIFYS
jgi:dephospho-CoA kinase